MDQLPEENAEPTSTTDDLPQAANVGLAHTTGTSRKPRRKGWFIAGGILLGLACLCGLAVAVIFALAALGSRVTAAAGQHNARGDEYYSQGDMDNAILEYSEAIRINPNYALAYYNRGLAYMDKKDLDQAISDFDQAMRLDPQEEHAYYWRGVAFLDKNDLDQAIKDFDQAIRLNPEDAYAYDLRGYANLRRGVMQGDMGVVDAALSDFSQAIQINPGEGGFYLDRAETEMELGKMEEAVLDYGKALELCGDQANLCRLAEQGISRAIVALDSAIWSNGLNARLYYIRGLAYVAQDIKEMAVTNFSKALELCGRDSQLCQQAQQKLTELADK